MTTILDFKMIWSWFYTSQITMLQAFLHQVIYPRMSPIVTVFTHSAAQRSCATNMPLLSAKLILRTISYLSSSWAFSTETQKFSSELQFLSKGDLFSNLFLRLFCFGDIQVGTCLELYSSDGPKSSLKSERAFRLKSEFHFSILSTMNESSRADLLFLVRHPYLNSNKNSCLSFPFRLPLLEIKTLVWISELDLALTFWAPNSSGTRHSSSSSFAIYK